MGGGVELLKAVRPVAPHVLVFQVNRGRGNVATGRIKKEGGRLRPFPMPAGEGDGDGAFADPRGRFDKEGVRLVVESG